MPALTPHERVSYNTQNSHEEQLEDIQRIQIRVIPDDESIETQSIASSTTRASDGAFLKHKLNNLRMPGSTNTGNKQERVGLYHKGHQFASKYMQKKYKHALRTPDSANKKHRKPFFTPFKRTHAVSESEAPSKPAVPAPPQQPIQQQRGPLGGIIGAGSKGIRRKMSTGSMKNFPTIIEERHVIDDPNMPFGKNLYKHMKENLKAWKPKMNTTVTIGASSVSGGEFASQRNDSFDEMFEAESPIAIVNVLDGKLARIKDKDEQYLTCYQHSYHLNPQFRFSDIRSDEDSIDQIFEIEHYDGDRCVLKHVVKRVGFIKPALFYSPITNLLELRDYYPYCPRERLSGYTVQAGKEKVQCFTFECKDYKVALPCGELELEIVEEDDVVGGQV